MKSLFIRLFNLRESESCHSKYHVESRLFLLFKLFHVNVYAYLYLAHLRTLRSTPHQYTICMSLSSVIVYIVGTLFRGVGTEANLAEAERWWRAAAWKNVPGACFELANALYIGWIAPPPSAAAFPDCTTRGIVRNWTETDRLLRKVLASGAPMNPTYEVNLTAGQILRRLLCTRGHIVRIHGLVQTPEFNGVLAEVQSTTSDSDAVLSDLPERIHVRPLLISGGASGVKAIRPSNLVAIAPRRPWAEPWAEIDFVADESGYDPAAAAYVWEYASGEDGNIVWCRFVVLIAL